VYRRIGKEFANYTLQKRERLKKWGSLTTLKIRGTTEKNGKKKKCLRHGDGRIRGGKLTAKNRRFGVGEGFQQTQRPNKGLNTGVVEEEAPSACFGGARSLQPGRMGLSPGSSTRCRQIKQLLSNGRGRCIRPTEEGRILSDTGRLWKVSGAMTSRELGSSSRASAGGTGTGHTSWKSLIIGSNGDE